MYETTACVCEIWYLSCDPIHLIVPQGTSCFCEVRAIFLHDYSCLFGALGPWLNHYGNIPEFLLGWPRASLGSHFH